MADREKVIKGLEKCLNPNLNCYHDDIDCPYEEQCWLSDSLPTRPLKEEALILLKEQEVKPTLIREGKNKYYNDYVCPSCDNELCYGQNYCSECGKAVKWE